MLHTNPIYDTILINKSSSNKKKLLVHYEASTRRMQRGEGKDETFVIK